MRPSCKGPGPLGPLRLAWNGVSGGAEVRLGSGIGRKLGMGFMTTISTMQASG